MRKPKKDPVIIEHLPIVDASSEGMGVGRDNNEVIFVKSAIPGDVVTAKITKRKKNLSEAEIMAIESPSDDRIEPFCQHFGFCGGCKWQQMSYQTQLKYKSKQVNDALIRIGKIELPQSIPILAAPQPTHYRNKMEYTFSDKAWLPPAEFAQQNNNTQLPALGFHVPGRFDAIVHIESCYLQNDLANQIRNNIHQIAQINELTYYNPKSKNGWLRNLMLRNNQCGEWMLVLVVAYPDFDNIEKIFRHILNHFKDIKSLYWCVNQKVNDSLHDQKLELYWGNPYLVETLGNILYQISPKSFFQTNSEQAANLYALIKSFAALQPHELAYDLYTGTGSIALFVAQDAKQVIGIEYIEEAILDAKSNALLNNITNCKFIAGDMKDVLNDSFLLMHGYPDVVITDPPRAGMHADVIATILRMQPKRIVYVSCNPSTQARDLQMLDVAYRVDKLQAVDMFPQTAHVENVVLLIKK